MNILHVLHTEKKRLKKAIKNRYIEFLRNTKYRNQVALFDTSIGSENCGDSIIMKFVKQTLDDTMGGSCFVSVPTHVRPDAHELERLLYSRRRIVCGTNLITPHFEKWSIWNIVPKNEGYSDIVTLGVGMEYYSDSISDESKEIYPKILSKKYLHSVRDSYTKNCFHKMGIDNVIVTGCPTLWKLTPELCRKIPKKKSNSVITTITDYSQDPLNDRVMLEILCKEYENVMVWIQGSHDEEYLKEISADLPLVYIHGGLEPYLRVLEAGAVDYVGTRLHAGICALNYGIRSIIISIDNRAIEMGKDFHLPVLMRSDVGRQLVPMINDELSTDIQLPMENIQTWKNQFVK